MPIRSDTDMCRCNDQSGDSDDRISYMGLPIGSEVVMEAGVGVLRRGSYCGEHSSWHLALGLIVQKQVGINRCFLPPLCLFGRHLPSSTI